MLSIHRTTSGLFILATERDDGSFVAPVRRPEPGGVHSVFGPDPDYLARSPLVARYGALDDAKAALLARELGDASGAILEAVRPVDEELDEVDEVEGADDLEPGFEGYEHP